MYDLYFHFYFLTSENKSQDILVFKMSCCLT
jgi:hypothetical protein